VGRPRDRAWAAARPWQPFQITATIRPDPRPPESYCARHDRILRRLKLRATGHQSGGRAQARVPGDGSTVDPLVRGPVRGHGGWAPGLLQGEQSPACGAGGSRATDQRTGR